MKDPAVRAVSLEARGLWIDMLCLMHESPRRGYLCHANGKPITNDQLARQVGASAAVVGRRIKEMEDAGVFSRTDEQVIYCRRMVRDEEIRLIRKEAGKLGGNPILVKHKSTTELKQIRTPSSSSSISSSEGKARTPESEFDYETGFHEIWELYPKKGRTKIIDSQRMYCECIAPDPIRLHESLANPLRPGGKWAESANWRRGFVFALSEYIRNRRDLEEPEAFLDDSPEKPTRKSAFEQALENA